jgi:hypothetical protein
MAISIDAYAGHYGLPLKVRKEELFTVRPREKVQYAQRRSLLYAGMEMMDTVMVWVSRGLERKRSA